MPAKRINPNRVKVHYSYTATELAKRLGVHKNTIRNWSRNGLRPLAGRPILFHGGSVRGFLAASNANRRKPCLPGTFYCFGAVNVARPRWGWWILLIGRWAPEI
jgi:hypothetical protein